MEIKIKLLLFKVFFIVIYNEKGKKKKNEGKKLLMGC